MKQSILSLSLVFFLVVNSSAVVCADETKEGALDAESSADVTPVDVSASSTKPNEESLTITSKDGAVFTLVGAPTREEDIEAFALLSDAERGMFFKKRKAAMTNLATILNYSRITIGMGAYTKDRFLQLFSRNKSEDALKPLIDNAENSSIDEKRKPKTREQYRHDIIQSFLSSIDEQIWSHAPFVANSNQFGFVVFGGINGGLHVLKKGFYVSGGVGMSFAYNYESRAGVWELFHDLEIARRAFPIVAQVEVIGKLMLQFSNLNIEQTPKIRTGSSHYLPGPFFVTETKDTFSVGVNPGIGFPPLGMFYIYQTNNATMPWLRMIVSPLLPGLLDFKFHPTLNPILFPVKLVVGKLLASTYAISKKTCQFVVDMAKNGFFKTNY